MGFFRRLLAGMGWHSMTAAAQVVLAQQLWVADHVVVAGVARNGNAVQFDLRKVIRGDAAALRFRSGQTLLVDAAWTGGGESVLLLLRGAGGGAAAHSTVAIYPLQGRGRISLDDVERLLRQPPFDTRSCHVVTRRGEYVLCTEILHAGTRSQGRRGTLYRSGVAVPGEKPGQIVATAAGGERTRFVFVGNERPHLWSVSGWDLESNPRAPGN